MFVGIGVGVHRQRFAGSFATSYSSRVIADGGTIEALDCVAAASSLLQSASLLIIPSGYKAGVAYAELPANGNGDLTWSRNSVANRTQSNGNIVSVAANVPRLSYMYGSCPALLLEPQRTNSLRNSTMQGASISPSTLPTNWAIAGGGLTGTVVGVGTENGLPYIDVQLIGTATGNVGNMVFESTSQIVASNGQAWTNSFWAKTISTTALPTNFRLTTIERTSAGSYITQTDTTFTPSSTLTRFPQTVTLAGGATVARVQPGVIWTIVNGQSYNFTIRIAAPQMELGAFATTWINTTNAAATRLVDTFTRNNIYTNGLISASGGTWYIEMLNNIAYTRDAAAQGIGIGDSSSTIANGFLIVNTGTGRQVIQKIIASATTNLFTTTTDTIKIAIKWNGTSADVFVNGVKQVSATAFTTTIMEFLNGTGAGIPRWIKTMALYPTPLSDSDCTLITT